MLETTKCELVRLTRLLASAVDLSGFAYRSVELSLGWSSGSMSQLMAGKVELKVRHVLQICEVIGFPPARLFHAAYPMTEPPPPGAAEAERLLVSALAEYFRGLASRGPGGVHVL